MIDLTPQFKKIEQKAQENEAKLNQPQKLNRIELVKLSKEQADLSLIIEKIDRYQSLSKQIKDNKKLIKNEPDMAEMAQSENKNLEKEFKHIESDLIADLLTADPQDKKDVILEIRAGTGGEEAELFAQDLFRMYQRYCQNKGFQFKIANHKRSDLGGIKEAGIEISGKNVFQNLKYEAGIHRVQRVPKTEKSGRLHTSAATVAVLPQAEETEIKIDPSDIEVATFRSSGPGGQSVNTTDSAVRITHKPTGLSVSCQDEKSQLKNRDKAMKILRARLLDQQIREEQAKAGQARKSMVGSGDRSEKIRTYNFPQNRLTDHRINYSSHNLEGIMDGQLDEIIKALQQADQKAKLENLK